MYMDGKKLGEAIFSSSSHPVDFGLRLLPAHVLKLFSLDPFGTACAKTGGRAGGRAMLKGANFMSTLYILRFHRGIYSHYRARAKSCHGHCLLRAPHIHTTY